MSQILTMAVQNLNVADRDDMVRYMKQAMVGTFFERWLKMGGWIGVESGESDDGGGGKMSTTERTSSAAIASENGNEKPSSDSSESNKNAGASNVVPAAAAMPPQQNNPTEETSCSCCCTTAKTSIDTAEKPTSAAELEKLIRAIGTNPNLDAMQKNLTIQGLRDSVWKSNCRVSKRKREEAGDVAATDRQCVQPTVAAVVGASMISSSRSETSTRHPHQTHHLR
jgi:hypothetical protein